MRFEGEWREVKLGDLGKCIRGVSYDGESDLSEGDTELTIRLFRSNNIQNFTIDLSKLQFVNTRKVKTTQILKRNDIVVCMANGSKDLVGKAAPFIITDKFKYTFGAFMGCFRTDENNANSEIVKFLFQSNRYRLFITNLLSGSSINNLKPSDIESIRFKLPLPEEQTAIAKVLQAADKEIQLLKNKLDKLKEQKKGLMQILLTGKKRLRIKNK